MKLFVTTTSTAIPLPRENVDTDQIIPARYLTTIAREGLGEGLFADWRCGADGTPRPEFVMNQPRYQGAEILVAGHNFGCGSSREHAVWALLEAGISAVISTGFADIFHNNALRNGLVPVVVDEATHAALMSALDDPAPPKVTVDLERLSLSFGDNEASFAFDSFAQHCITHGLDELGYLLEHLPNIERYESAQKPRVNTLGG